MRSQSDPRIPIDILRIVYAAMLEQLPRAAVLDFWLRHAGTLGHAPSDPARLLRFLAHEGSRAHRSAVFRVLNNVEPYLIEHDISAERFVEHAFAHVGGGIMVPAARFVAMALEDFGAFFRRSVDVRRMLLSSIHTFQKRYIPCMIYRVVDVRASKTVTNALMFCSHDTPAKILAVILAEYVDHGRTSFDRKRFICDSTVIATRKNPGFSRRLQIVQAALGDKCPQLRIERSARGKYALRADCEVVYCRRSR